MELNKIRCLQLPVLDWIKYAESTFKSKQRTNEQVFHHQLLLPVLF